MKSRAKGRKVGRVVRYTATDGTTREYHYGPHKRKRIETPTDTIEALITAYCRAPEWTKLAEFTRRNHATYLKELSRVGHVRVADVRRRDLLTARDAIMVKRGRGAAAGFTATCATLFNWAVDREWIDASPATRLQPPGKRTPLRAWTVQQADAAQGALPEHLRRVVILGRYTGQRRTDLCRMTWRQFDGETIRVRQQKTDRELVIPCHPTLRAELLRWRQDAASVMILTNTLGKPWNPIHLSHVLPEALVRLGLPALNVHGLRKLAATSLADAGASTHEIAAVTGHRTLQMVAHYTATADQERLAGAAIHRLTYKTGTKQKASE